jgi:hyperosmotically inducible periplasmic protein
MKIIKVTLLASLIALLSVAAAQADSSADRKIAEAAKASYNFRTVLDGKVSVAVTDGVVTLTGQVPDTDMKQLAEDTVKDLPGVTQVDNEIVVKPAAEESDTWISTKIHWVLLTRSNVSLTDTTVKVQDGVVTLTGNVDNSAQKDLTQAYVKQIKGVKSVDNELVVKTPTSSSESAGNYIDDASVTTQVKYALHSNDAVTPQPSVETSYGVVIITGEATSDAEKALVTKIAQSVRGVKSVSNNMTVKGS